MCVGQGTGGTSTTPNDSQVLVSKQPEQLTKGLQQVNDQQSLQTTTTASSVTQALKNQGAVAQKKTISYREWEESVDNNQMLDSADAARDIIKTEFEKDQKAESKASSKRNARTKEKKKIYDLAKETAGKLEAAPQAQQTQFDPKVVANKIYTLEHHDRDYMAFDDDEAFIKNFDKNYEKLKEITSLEDDIKNITDEDYDKVKKEYGVVRIYFPKLKELKEEVENHKKIKEYYEAKLKLISNPYYTVLKREDMDLLSNPEIDAKIDQFKNVPEKKNLLKYLESTKALRALARQGIYKEEESYNATALKKSLDGGTGKYTKGYVKLGSADVSFHAEGGAEGRFEGKSVGKVKKISTGHHPDTIEDEKNKGMYATAELGTEAKVVAAKASIKTQGSLGKVGANFSTGRIKATLAGGGKLGYTTKDGFMAKLGGKAKLESQAVKGRVKGAFHLGEKFTWFGIDAKATGKALEGTASAEGNVGIFKYKTASGEEKYVGGAEGGFELGTSVATGSATVGITILGVRIGLTGRAMALGAGAIAKGYVHTGGIGGELGVIGGLIGASVKLDLDWSQLTEGIFKKLFRIK